MDVMYYKSIYDRIKDNEWKYPSRPNKKYCEEFGKDWKEEIKYYNKQCSTIDTRFKLACFEDLGIENNLKREEAYSFAYEEGHSGGLYEVYQYLSKLLPLIES